MKARFEGGPLDGMEAVWKDGHIEGLSDRTVLPFDIETTVFEQLPQRPTHVPLYRAVYIVFREVDSRSIQHD